MNRVYNFGAGPAGIPTEVLKEAQEHLVDYHNEGMSIMESSHRAKMYDDVHLQALELIRELYMVPSDYEILFLQGGASTQFAMVPMNLSQGGKAQYINTGAWAEKAIKEAKILGVDVDVVASSKESAHNHIPKNIKFDDKADYVYMTSNNTIYGTQFKEYPQTKAPLIVDASSDIFSYEVDWSRVDLLFAGAQKNAGPAGVTIVIIKNTLLDRVKETVPTMFRYKTHADANSLYNTPPTFGIYLLSLILKWIKAKGGIKQIAKDNEAKAKILYDAIDNSNGFYVGHSQKEDRSLMNVSFNIKNKDTALEEAFVKLATSKKMIGLKGHRSTGGIRASIYNAMSFEGVEALVSLMETFAKENS